jgi:hypothetical protein
METLISVCHRRKKPRMTLQAEGNNLVKFPKSERLNSKRERILDELREADMFLKEYGSGNSVQGITFAKALAISCSVNAALRLIASLKISETGFTLVEETDNGAA